MKTHYPTRSNVGFIGAVLLVLSPKVATADYAATLLSHNPLAYWRLDETSAAPPLNKVANSGTVGSIADGYAVQTANLVQKGESGIVGNCIRFNNPGVTIGHCGSRVDIPYGPGINPNPPFSVEFWAKPNALPASDSVGVCPITSLNQNWFSGANRTGWLLYCNNLGRWNLRLGLSSGTYAVNFTANTGTAAAGVWQHMVFTYDGSAAILYANGVPIGSASASGWTPNTQSALRIGGTELNGDTSDNPAPNFNATGQGHAGNRGWDGWIDEVAVYASILSPSTVAAHFAAATTNNAGYHSQVLAASPVGYWSMEEPAVTPPDPGTFPLISNSGSLGSDADGTNMWGALTAQSGAGYAGFGGTNKAIYFDGENGFIGLKDAAGLHFSGHITLMAWIKPTVEDFYRDILVHGYDSSYHETFLRISRGFGGTGAGDGNYYELGVTDNSGYYDAVLFPIPSGDIGTWVFLAGTFDGSSWTLYRNGVPVGSTTSENGALDVALPWSIGSRSNPSASEGMNFGGWIDEPAIFNTALSAADILSLYTAAAAAPSITRPLQVPIGVYKGSSGSFDVWAAGSPTLGYRWTSNGVPLSVSSTTTNITLNNLSAGTLNVAVVVTNASGSATSSVSFVVVASKPLITQQPAPVTRYIGLPFQFSVAAAGTTPIFYQWYSNSVPISGATSPTYGGVVSAAAAGNYSCLLSNEAGTSNTLAVALTPIAIPAGYPRTVITNVPRPVAYWRLGEASGTVAHDYVGGNDGAYYAVTLGVPGYSVIDPDTAGGFGNVNTYVGSISGTGVNFSGHVNFTLEAWVNGPPGQADESTIIAKGNGSSGTTASEQFSLDVQSGNYHFFTRGGGNSYFEASASVGPNGTWQHVVCVYDDLNETGGGPLQMYIYVNGELKGQGGGRPSGLRASSSPVSIGSKHLGNDPAYDGYFSGTIDEVAFYPYAMSNSVVQQHYSAAYGPSLPPLIALQPVSVTNFIGLQASFLVGAGGTQPLSYQWRKGTTDIPGATTESYTIQPLDYSDAASYRVFITNLNGSITSAAATLTVLGPPTNPPAIPGLVLHLPFDNNLTDTSGRGNNAVGVHLNRNLGVTSSNIVSATFVSDGALGQGMNFSTGALDSSGTNWDNFYASLGDRADLHFSSNYNFSVALWIRTPANMTFGDLPYFCSAVGSTFSAGLVFAYTYGYGSTPYPGGWAFSAYDTAGNGVGGRGELGSINDGGWHHLVHVFDRRTGAVTYLDGVLVPFHKQAGASFTGVGNVDTGNYFNIGQDPTGLYVEPGSGDIDDLGVWKKALTPLEAASIYIAAMSNHLSFASAPITLTIQKVGTQIRLSWPAGMLQSADSLSGPYTDITPQSPSTVTPTTARKFYRVRL